MRRSNNNSLLKIVITFVIFFLIFSAIKSIFNTSDDSNDNTNPYYENHEQTYISNVENNNVNYDVASGVRNKYTKIIGDGKDEVTVMFYMIGTDLQSQYGMAIKDIYELLEGMDGNNINVVLQTGGCKNWHDRTFSNSVVERWYITSEPLTRLKNAGKVSMTNPKTLTDFIEYSADNFPANRYVLILWDHGGGSEAGFGYDENYPNSGSLSPDLLAKALGDVNVKGNNIKFDFIGFDACLMANVETAIALEPYADYLVASEETEPGEGWFHTNWINMLENNTSTPTLDIGKTIIDDYISNTKKSDSSAQMTLSITDLGELVYNINQPLQNFSKSMSDKLNGSDYQSVATARYNTKEFSKDSQLDQVDLVDLASKMDVDGSDELVNAVKSAVKYNKTYNINNSYGLSIYFPYASLSMVNSMVNIYDNINMEKEYTSVVKSFASYASSGQIVTQNSGSTSTSLFDLLLGDSYYYDNNYYSNDYNFDSYNNSDDYYGYDDSFGYGYDSWIEPSVGDIMSTFFRSNNIIKPNSLIIKNKDNQKVVSLSEDEWNLVDSITLNMFIDDGQGYLDLGRDNTFEFNNHGDLVVDSDGSWLCVNDHVVSYEFVSDEILDNKRVITGYIPAYLNDQRVNLIVNFVDDNDGVILGAKSIYEDSNIQAKGLIPINDGDEIKFVCNYYGYDGKFIDEYQINDVYKVNGDMKVYNIYLDNNYIYTYCFKDIYGNKMWTPKTVVENKQ